MSGMAGPERRGPECSGPDYPPEWDDEPDDTDVPQHRTDPDCWCRPVQADNGAWDHQ